ncbi:hypothetical protein BH24DEI2_BH24DEI2_25770 [soil metagenome]
MRLRTFFLTIFLAVGFGYGADAPPIRVLIAEVAGPVTVPMAGPHRGFVDDNLAFSTLTALAWPLSSVAGKIVVDGQAVGHSFTLEPTDGTFVSWEGRPYRGALRFVATGASLEVINVVDLESYLRGVVPAEVPASWPTEALKAQAVAARTYTLASLQSGENYDVCATTECQKYGGAAAEHPRSDAAISATSGIVLTYYGTFAKTYYHADSGGVLASSAEVWGDVRPYLVARQDVPSTTPHRSWQKQLNGAVIQASLSELGLDIGGVQVLQISGYSESGRVSSVVVVGATGSTTLSGPSLTKLLRTWGLKSTRFSMTGALSAQGDGWGHGVGMSQYGANALASANYDYSQILAFYYPTTDLQTLTYAATTP